jgi:2-hydroxy-3-keto-5-methylthiopentenyl-1-phosphate phosphatase
MGESAEPRGGVFVSDFDGTMTRVDFYKVAVEGLAPADQPDHWGAYVNGHLTHFEALQGIYRSIHKSEAEVLAAMATMGLEPNLRKLVGELSAAGWRVVVASAGSEWYIRRLLSGAGVGDLEVNANPGRFVEGAGLHIALPTASPYFSPEMGIDKAAVVRAALATGQRVAFAGDGHPDAAAARLVEPHMRVARSALAETLRAEGLSFVPFDHWADVARALLDTR